MQYVPLMDDYIGSLAYYREEVDKFIGYMTELIEKGTVKIYDTTYNDRQAVYDYLTEEDTLSPPDINNYMPDG